MPSEYDTDKERERKRAYRERQKTEQALAEAEEAYVAAQLAQTREYASSFRAPEKKSKEALAARMERAEAYARWRWQAYLDGEVFSL